MEVAFSKNTTVVYGATWLTCGHPSHIGVGSVIEFYTGLVPDCTALQTFVLDALRAERNAQITTSGDKHQCQKNTATSAGRMEVEAAL